VGKITTYKDLANAIGCPSPRAIGQALKHNPFAPIVPCHRVVRSNGNVGGFCGKTSGKKIQEKIKLLQKEGIIIEKGTIKHFPSVRWEFS